MMNFFKNGEDYERIGFRKWRVLKGFDTVCGFRPPADKETGLIFPIETKFGLFTPDGVLRIEKGFMWDGATMALDTDDIMKASCVHDWFCNAVDNGTLPVSYRLKGDDLFKRICLEEGMPEFRAYYCHAAVVAYGKAKYNVD